MADFPMPTSVARTATQDWFLRWGAQTRASFSWMVIIGLILRIGFIVVGHTYRLKTLDDNFSFGFEMGRIGRSLAESLSLIHI